MSETKPKTMTMYCPDCKQTSLFTCDERAEITKTAMTPGTGGWLCGNCGQYLRDGVMRRLYCLEDVKRPVDCDKCPSRIEYAEIVEYMKEHEPTFHDGKGANQAIGIMREKTVWTRSDTPEPVPVEDITPGWYWSTSPEGETGYTNMDPITRKNGAYEQLIQYEWYRAPSPEELLEICKAWTKENPLPEVKTDVVAVIEPEPVAVEDITPGWYWMVSNAITPPVTHYIESTGVGDGRVICSSLTELAGTPLVDPSHVGCEFYRAPSPEELMAMCGGDRDKQPPTEAEIVAEAREASTNQGGAGGNVNFIASDIPPAVEVALRVLETKLWATLTDMWSNAQAVVRDYLAEHAPNEQPKDEPDNTRPCGKCANWKPDGDCDPKKYGQCDRGKRCVDSPSCQHFTEKPQPVVETCGECGNYTDVERDGYSPGECKARQNFTTKPTNIFARGCPVSTPKAKEPAR